VIQISTEMLFIEYRLRLMHSDVPLKASL